MTGNQGLAVLLDWPAHLIPESLQVDEVRASR